MKKRLKTAVGGLLVAAGIVIIAVSALFAGPLSEKQIARVAGVFSAYEEQNPMFRPVVITRRIRLEDGRAYTIGSDTHTSFDKDVFLNQVNAGDDVELIVDTATGNALAIYHNGREYMNYAESLAARRTNQTIGIIIGAALAVAGASVFAAVRAQKPAA